MTDILKNLVKERIDYYQQFSQKKFNGQQIMDMLSNLIEQSESRGHDIQVGFRKGQVYCKKCGDKLE